jgi:hypothetical protein
LTSIFAFIASRLVVHLNNEENLSRSAANGAVCRKYRTCCIFRGKLQPDEDLSKPAARSAPVYMSVRDSANTAIFNPPSFFSHFWFFSRLDLQEALIGLFPFTRAAYNVTAVETLALPNV